MRMISDALRLNAADRCVRRDVPCAIIQERTRAAAARARGRSGGRPPVLDEKDKAAAIALLRHPDIPVKEVARRLGISVAALYAHLPGGLGAVLEETVTKKAKPPSGELWGRSPRRAEKPWRQKSRATGVSRATTAK